MNVVAFDTETHLIRPGLLTPKVVCLSTATRDSVGGMLTGLFLPNPGVSHFRQWLLSDDVVIVGHNVWYDLGVLCAEDPSLIPLVFEKLEKGLLRDTQLRQIIIDVAEGEAKFQYDEDTGEYIPSRYALADLSWRLLKKYVKKGSDTWRLRYALLDGIPTHGWPEDARKYAIEDSELALEVYEAQEKLIQKADWTFNEDTGAHVLANQNEQHRAAWALYLMSIYGIRTDGKAVAALKASLQADYAEFMDKLRPTGLFNISPARALKSGPRKGEIIPEKISKYMKAIYARVEKCFKDRGEEVPLTDGGKCSTDRKTLNATKDPDLIRLAEAGATAKLLQTYVPVLEGGVFCPICARYNPLMETGRTSCAKPNLQNPPRKGGVRECFIPRPGHAFVFVDYDTLELRALAQVCLDLFGHSEMAEALRRGEDLHLSLAAEMLDIEIEEAKRRFDAGDPEIKEARQHAKIANFGFPGGMGTEGFRVYAEGFGLVITEERAKELRDMWFARWPEMRRYFEYIGKMTEKSDQLTQLRSGRVRGGASFCASANSFFQGLAADGAKEALWMVARECYLEDPYNCQMGPTPLYGCRPVLFLHDEIGMEVPLDDPHCASNAADRLAEVMIASMEKWITDVPVTAKPVMVRRWFKGAEPVRVKGILVPSRPLKEGKRTVWVADADQAQAA
jgi:DNA polymerase-1